MTPFFYSVRAFACIRQTLLLKILRRWMHGPSRTSNFGGPSPQPPIGLRPSWGLLTIKLSGSVVFQKLRNSQYLNIVKHI